MSRSESNWKILEFKSRVSRAKNQISSCLSLKSDEELPEEVIVLDYNGQATKGSRWIPWHTEAMKDVVTCDKSRGAGNTL